MGRLVRYVRAQKSNVYFFFIKIQEIEKKKSSQEMNTRSKSHKILFRHHLVKINEILLS